MRLSKREMIMLIFLIIVAVLFIEYRFVIVPGMARYDELTAKKMQTQDRVNTIQLNLAIAKQNEKKRDDNLDAIKDLAKRYFSELQMDAILVRTHDLVMNEGFSPSQYSISTISAVTLEPYMYGSFDISYELKTLAKTYQTLREQNVTEEQDSNTPDAPINGDQVEQYQIAISAIGTYDQVKSFLDAINGLQRSVVISSLSLTPDLSAEPVVTPTEPAEPGAPEPTSIPEPATPEDQLLTINMTLYYYGLAKLLPDRDEYNEWYREPFIPVTYTPFKQPPTPTPSGTDATTAEATP